MHFITVSAASPAVLDYSSFDSVPESFEISASENGSVSGNGDSLKLMYKADGEFGKAEVLTQEINLSGSLLYIDFSFTISGMDEKSVRTVSLEGENAFYSTPVMEIRGDKLLFFGSDSGMKAEENKKYFVSAGINFSGADKAQAEVFVNDARFSVGEISLHKYIDLSAVHIRLSDKARGIVTGTDIFDIHELKVSVTEEIPAVRISEGQRLDFKEGETVSVSAAAEGNFDLLEFYVNGEKYASCEDGNAACILSSTPGVYSVYARVLFGAFYVETEAVNITVYPNTAPTVYFKDLDGSLVMEEGSLDFVELDAEDEDGIASVTVYINGKQSEILTNAPYLVDITGLPLGTSNIRAVAEDSFGKASECTLSAEVYKYFYEDYLNESEFGDSPEGFSFITQSGFIETRQTDKGNSLFIGMDTPAPGATSGEAYANISVSSLKSFVLEFDFKTDALYSSSLKRAEFRTAKGHMYFLNMADNLKIGPNYTASMDYEPDTWYHFTLDADLNSHVIKCSVDGGPSTAVNIDSSLTSLGSLRLCGPAGTDVKTYAAFDNIVIRKKTEVPVVADVNGGKPVPAGSTVITARLSGSLMPSSVNASTVSLIDSDGRPAAVESVEYNAAGNMITIKTKSGLKSDSKYYIVLSGDVLLNDAVSAGKDIFADFSTTREGVGISECIFTKTGKALNAGLSAYNESDTDFDGYAVMTVWSGNSFRTKIIEHVSISAGDTADVTLTCDINDGGAAEVYLYDSLIRPDMAADRIYRFG